MIYVVTQQILEEYEGIKVISVEESLNLLTPLKLVGLDTETSGINCHECELLSIQLGCPDFQVVIDCITVDILFYKEYLERKDITFILWNARFDLKFLFKHGIVPYHVWDGFLAEKILWLGYPTVLSPEIWERIKEDRYEFVPPSKKGNTGSYVLFMSLESAAKRYLGKRLNKSIRGQIIWRGLSEAVIRYSAEDIEYLEPIMNIQLNLLKEKGLDTAIKYSNRFIFPIAYMEFCGVRVSIEKWEEKIRKDQIKVNKSLQELNKWFIENFPESKYIVRDLQGDLFSGFNTEPKVTLNWNSTKQVIPIFKHFGVDVEVVKDGEDKESLDAKVLKPQSHKCSLVPLYIKYREAIKVTTTYGKNVLKQINKRTGRLHTNFNPIGTDTTRISSGGKDKSAGVKYINMLNIPRDETRECFVAEDGNKFISIDYSAQESCIMADMANDEVMIYELNEGSGDLHSLTAKLVFPEIPEDTPVKDIKRLYPELRQEAKGYEFCFAYAGNDRTLVQNYGLTPERAKEIYDNYMSGLSGLKAYQEWRKKDWWDKGYIDLNPKVGFKTFIYDYKYLKETQESFKELGFWDRYRGLKDTNPSHPLVVKVKEFFKRKAASDKQSVNYPIQHTGALCIQVAMINFFEYLRSHNLLFKVLLTVLPYDEICCETPKEIAEEIASVLKNCMVEAGAYFVSRVKLGAELSRNKDGSLPDHWVH